MQFWIYLGKLLHGDLGRSVMTSHTVAADIVRFFPATFELATAAIIIATLIGVPLGVFAAVRQGTRIDHMIRVVCLAGQSLPVFVLRCCRCWCSTRRCTRPRLRPQNVLYDEMVPRSPACSASMCGSRASGTVLGRAGPPGPTGRVLAYFCMAYIARMTRAFMLETLRGEYIITARAKGLSVRPVSSGGTPSATSPCGS